MKYVPLFNYHDPDIDLNKGDEFYEVRVFDGEREIKMDLNENPAHGVPWAAIEAAKHEAKHEQNTHVLVTVHGDRYPDGTTVPEGGIVWDSRSQIDGIPKVVEGLRWYLVGTLSRYVLVQALNEGQATNLGRDGLYALFSETRQHTGPLPIDIRTVRLAYSYEIDLWKFHLSNLAEDAKRLQG